MMIPMSFSETIFLFLLALVIFGPKKLPEIARQVGKYLNEFKRASNEFKAQIEQEIAHLDVEKHQTILPPSPSVEGTTSRTLNSAPVEEAKVETSAPAEAAAPEAATLASSVEEHASSSGNGATPPVATEAAPASEEVTSDRSQESHA
jgi:sec-independent protein translocase protein TatB